MMNIFFSTTNYEKISLVALPMLQNCFLPLKSKIFTVNGTYDNWSVWTSCSPPVGNNPGLQNRSRACNTHIGMGMSCEELYGPAVETRDCVCPLTHPWTFNSGQHCCSLFYKNNDPYDLLLSSDNVAECSLNIPCPAGECSTYFIATGNLNNNKFDQAQCTVSFRTLLSGNIWLH